MSDLPQPGPDLTKLVRLAVQRDHLRLHNRNDPYRRQVALAAVAEGLALAGAYDRAEALAVQINDPAWRADVLATLAGVMATGDSDRADRIATEAECLVAPRTIHRARVARVLARLAGATAAHDRVRATRWATEAEAIGIDDYYAKASERARLATAVATWDADWAARLAEHAEYYTRYESEQYPRELVLSQLVGVAAARGAYDRAEALAVQIDNPACRAEALVRLVEAVGSNDRDTAARLATEIEALAARITHPRPPGVLIVLAATLLNTEPDHRSRSPVLARARRLLAEALVSDSWTTAPVAHFSWLVLVPYLARVDPAAVEVLADELERRSDVQGATATGEPGQIDRTTRHDRLSEISVAKQSHCPSTDPAPDGPRGSPNGSFWWHRGPAGPPNGSFWWQRDLASLLELAKPG